MTCSEPQLRPPKNGNKLAYHQPLISGFVMILLGSGK